MSRPISFSVIDGDAKFESLAATRGEPIGSGTIEGKEEVTASC